MIETSLEMMDKIGYLLFKKGIIDGAMLEKALAAKANDKSKIKRNLAQILVQDFDYDHDTIFKEVAILYAFRELEIIPEEVPPRRVEAIRKMINDTNEQLKNQMLQHSIIPFMYDDRSKDKLILAATDPTDRNIPKIAFGLQAKKYEVVYIQKKDFDRLIQIILPPENVYLKAMEDVAPEIEIDKGESSLDEDELDAEINKSALINLVEGALLEGVRKGASDIHFVPKSGNKTEIDIRIDGLLQPWHTQEGTLPEAVIAVVKDRSKGMDGLSVKERRMVLYKEKLTDI